MNYRLLSLLPTVLLWVAFSAAAETPRLQEALRGTVILHGGGAVSRDLKDAFLSAAGGRKAVLTQLVAGAQKTLFMNDDYAELRALTEPSHPESETEAFLSKLSSSTGVWIEGSRDALSALCKPAVERALRSVLDRGGVVAGSGEAAGLFARHFRNGTEFRPGVGLLENILVHPQFNPASNLSAPAGYALLGIPDETALIVRDRWAGVMGSGKVTIAYAKSVRRPELRFDWSPASRGDLITLSRAALARAEEPPFPPMEAPVPEVPEKGLLVIGGSGVPRAGVERFVKHSGGAQAKIVIITTALDDTPPAEPFEVKMLQRYGVKALTVLHAPTRAEAEAPAFLEPLRSATGLWFCGGRQWRLVDKYLGTAAEKEMHALLARGGAIAGGSAGATIQGEYLVRGNPLGNVQMIVEGYERGLGFLKGVGIDQHFTQRNRFKDMTLFKIAVPQYLGIGIDEDTALLVSGHVAEIVGNHSVAFYDKAQPLPAGAKDYTSVSAGEFYDLKGRKKK